MLRKAKNEIWLCTNVGLYSYSTLTRKFRYHTGVLPFNKYWEYTDALDDGKGNLYLNTGGNGIHCYNLRTGFVESYQIRPGPHPETDDFYFWNLVQYDSNTILAATFCGVGVFDISSKKFKVDSYISNVSYSLLPDEVFSLFKDKANSVWLGCKDGISRIDPINQACKFVEVFANHDTVISNVIYDSMQNVCYFASMYTSYLGKNIGENMSRNTSRNENSNLIPAGKEHSEIYKMIQDSEYVWCGTSQGLLRYSKYQGKFKFYTTKQNNNYLGILDICFDSKKNIWLASNTGLYLFKPNNNWLEQIKLDSISISTRFTSIFFDQSDESLWLCYADFGKLIHYFINTEKYVSYSFSTQESQSLASAMPVSATQAKDGAIWVITNPGGITQFIKNKDGKYYSKNYFTENGLPTNYFRDIITDNQNRLWLTYEDKLCCFDYTHNIIRNYGQEYGIKLPDAHSNLTLASNGDILLPTKGGYYIFNPDSLFNSTEVGQPIVTSFRVMNHEKLEIVNSGKPLKTDYNENFINVEFTANNYQSLSENKIFYMMEGVDTAWIYAGDKREASYPNLADGKYTFKLKLVNILGQATQNINPPVIIIKPYFTKSPYFLAAVSILTLLLIYFFYKRKVAQIRHESEVTQEIKELEARALRSQMNPHFIFNCINGIQETIIVQDFEAAYNYLTKFSKLLRMVLNNSEQKLLPLYQEIEFIKLYLELESVRLKNNFSFSINLDDRIDDEETMFPTMVLQTYVENSIWHGLQHKVGQKNLTINFTCDTNYLICKIEDNGVGRKKAAEIKNNKIGGQHFKSKGTDIALRRIELMNQEKQNSYLVEIIDLHDKSGLACGTKVIIKTPL